MKTSFTIIALLIAFSSSVFALNTSSHEDVGVKIVEWSPQLLADFQISILGMEVKFKYYKKGNKMKKSIAVITMLIALSSSAFAHHPAQSDTAGVNIPDSSPHLTMVF